jgi:AcrR family transcriptional regulator
LPTSTRKTSWAGVPAEERQARRRTALLDAAFDLLGTEGWDATTVRAVVERARLNPRYFYESFEDIDALVVAVYDRVVEDLGNEVLAALETTTLDPAAQAREVVGRIVEFVDEDRRRGRVLYVEGIGNEALNRRRMEAGQGVVAFFERYAVERHGEAPFGHVDRVAASIVVGGFSQLLIDWLAGRINVTRTQLIDDATMLFLALGDATRRVPRA